MELMICTAIVSVLFVMLLPFGPGGRERSNTMRCLANLKQVDTAFQMWATDHKDRFPMMMSTNSGGTMEFESGPDCYRHFQSLQPYLGRSTRVFVCPSDNRQAAETPASLNNSNLSYFINLDATPTKSNGILSGDRYIQSAFSARNGVFVVGTNTTLSWSRQHEEKRPNQGILAFAAGHCANLKNEALQQALKTSAATARLLLPE